MSKFKNISDISLNDYITECGINANKHGWIVRHSEIPTYLMLIVTELSEAMDSYRDDNYENFEIEIIDTLIRLFHMCYDLKIDTEQVLKAKMIINENRPYKHNRKVI